MSGVGVTSAPATSAASLAEIADRLTEYAEPVARDAVATSVAIGVITDEGLVETRFIGSNYAGEAVSVDTVFEIGSATKAFLGVTEAMLVERGELAWNDRVIDHAEHVELSDPWVTREFRVTDLLAQRTGLPGYASELMSFFGYPWRQNVAGLKYVRPAASFRGTFAYQNVPHYVAGEIVAEWVGAASWNDAAKQLIFDPLHMTSTATDAGALVRATDSTRGRTYRDGKHVELTPWDFPSETQGAGSIVSNLRDMANWVAMHLTSGDGPTGRLLSAEQLENTYRGLVPVTDTFFLDLVHMGTARPAIHYATGWFVHALPEGRVIEHGGITTGYNSAVMFDPDRRIGLVVLTNQGHEGGVASKIGRFGMDLIQGRSPVDYAERARSALEGPDARAPLSSDARPIAQHVGVYEHPLAGALEFRTDGEVLHTNVGPRQWDATATRSGDHEFSLRLTPDAGSQPDLVETEMTFDATGDFPQSLTIQGFRFDRK